MEEKKKVKIVLNFHHLSSAWCEILLYEEWGSAWKPTDVLHNQEMYKYWIVYWWNRNVEKCRTLNERLLIQRTFYKLHHTPVCIGEWHITCPTLELSREKTHTSALRQNFKSPHRNFFSINMCSLYAKFQFSIFKTEGEVWGIRRTTCTNRQ